MVERRERISQRTCLNDSWTWKREWSLTVGERDGPSGTGQKGKNWDICNRINNKK